MDPRGNLFQRVQNLEKENVEMSKEIVMYKRIVAELKKDLKGKQCAAYFCFIMLLKLYFLSVLYEAVGLPLPTHNDTTPSNADLPVVNPVGDADTTVISPASNGSQQGQGEILISL